MAGASTAVAALLLGVMTATAAYSNSNPQYKGQCANSWKADLVHEEGEWQGAASFELVGSDKLLYVLDLQENAGFSLAEISFQATQRDGSLLSMTLSLPLCNDLFCPEPFFFRSTSGMMNTLQSAVSLGLARLSVQTTGEASQLLHGEIAMNCNPSVLDTVASTSSISCPLAQAPMAYEIPEGCTGVQERLQTHCGLSPQAVALASGFLYSVDGQSAAGFAPGLSICLPEGCRPCEIETTQMTSEGHFQVDSNIAAAVMQMPKTPTCTQPGFANLYDIPKSCDRFSDRAAVICGLSTVELASASAALLPGGFAGFGPGQSVCLPDDCDPCSDDSWFDSVIADIMDMDMQRVIASEMDEADLLWDAAEADAAQVAEDTDMAVDGQAEPRTQASSLLKMLRFW